MSEEIRWGIAIVLAAAIMYLPILSYKLIKIPARLDSDLKDKLNKYEGNGDEISQVIYRLSVLQTSIGGQQENYINVLMKCFELLAVIGITVSISSEGETYRNVGSDEIKERTHEYGMTRRQLLEFLRQLRIEGIIDPDYSKNYETFHLNEFGRQVVKRIKQTRNG